MKCAQFPFLLPRSGLKNYCMEVYISKALGSKSPFHRNLVLIQQGCRCSISSGVFPTFFPKGTVICMTFPRDEHPRLLWSTMQLSHHMQSPQPRLPARFPLPLPHPPPCPGFLRTGWYSSAWKGNVPIAQGGLSEVHRIPFPVSTRLCSCRPHNHSEKYLLPEAGEQMSCKNSVRTHISNFSLKVLTCAENNLNILHGEVHCSVSASHGLNFSLENVQVVSKLLIPVCPLLPGWEQLLGENRLAPSSSCLTWSCLSMSGISRSEYPTNGKYLSFKILPSRWRVVQKSFQLCA